MSGRTRASFAAGAIAGSTAVGLAAFAHVSAGGELSVVVALLATIAIGALCGLAASRVRVTFWRAAALAVAAQPALHLAFDGGGTQSHHHHAGAHPMSMSSSSSTDTRMLVAHVGVALVAAVLIRWGARWLCTMPEIARAIVMPLRSVVVPTPLRSDRMPALAVVGGSQSPVSRWWDNRGPPE